MTTLLRDTRYGIRMLLRSPGFTIVTVLTLALGISGNVALFSIVDAVLLRPLPFEDPDRLMFLWESEPDAPVMMVSYPDFLDWRRQAESFSGLALYNRFGSVNLTGSGEPQRLSSGRATPDLFGVLGVGPALGRGFLEAENRPGSSGTVILSDGLWRRSFGADPELLGRSLTLDGEPYTVVGIMPASFTFGRVDLWIPLGPTVDEGMLDRGNHPGLIAVGRIRGDVTLEQARAEMDAIAGRLRSGYPQSNSAVGVTVTPMREAFVSRVRPTLLSLLGAVAFVLLIACANVANLHLARAAVRCREIAVRAALGAGRYRLVRQLLTESTLLALLGGALGLVLAMWSIDLVQIMAPAGISGAAGPRIDQRVLIFTGAISLLTGILFGILPALQVSRVNIFEALKSGGRSLAGRVGRSRLRGVILIGEVALSLVLLVGAGLMIRSFVRLVQVDPGFRPENVVTLQVSLPEARYGDGAPVASFFRQAREKIEPLASVDSVAAISHLPFSGSSWQAGISIDGRAADAGQPKPLVDVAAVTPDYFRTMTIPLVRGRDFNDRDDRRALPVAVVNETMVRRFWPGDDPIGWRVRFGGPDSDRPWLEVVGVVGDVKQDGLAAAAAAELYIPHAQQEQPLRTMAMVARATGDTAVAATELRAVIGSIDGEQPVYAVRTLDRLVAASTGSRRFSMTVLSLFAGVALILASVGLYGVVSYMVSQQTREIGIRIVLGAQPRSLLRRVVGEGLRLSVIGVALGTLAAMGLTRVLAGLLYEVDSRDPLTFSMVALLLIAVALAASYIPARRAARVDPMKALRYE